MQQLVTKETSVKQAAVSGCSNMELQADNEADLCSADFSGLDVVVLVPGEQAAGAEAQPGQHCHHIPLLLLG